MLLATTRYSAITDCLDNTFIFEERRYWEAEIRDIQDQIDAINAVLAIASANAKDLFERCAITENAYNIAQDIYDNVPVLPYLGTTF